MEQIYDVNCNLSKVIPLEKSVYLAMCGIYDFDDDIKFLYSEAVQFFIDKDFNKCFKYSVILLEKTWEKLNTGHWKDVPVSWRQMYSSASVLKLTSIAFFKQKLSLNEVKEMIKICDMALLMGINILNNLFHKIIAVLSNEIQDDLMDFANSIIQKKTIKKLSVYDCNNNIQVETTPSYDIFQRICIESKYPLIFRNCIEHWPARVDQKWNFQYLYKTAGFRIVPVEIGSKYTDENWSQKLMPISDFIEQYIFGENKAGHDVGYLAQHQLFDQIPELQNDIVIPDYCCLSNGDNFDDNDIEINAWFGPANTVSPCHYDKKKNILVQVVGSKFIKLFSPSLTPNLYPHEGLLTNTSQLNAEEPDLKKFPLFTEAEKECSSFVLNAGDMLYIPPKHWHYIRSLEPSMSVSFWW